jgi:hypothetical protein
MPGQTHLTCHVKRLKNRLLVSVHPHGIVTFITLYSTFPPSKEMFKMRQRVPMGHNAKIDWTQNIDTS